MCELRASAVPWQRLCSLPCVSLNPSPLLPEGEDTGGDITTPLLADFSFDLVSAKLPRYKLFCINILLNDWIMNLCVCTFWRWDHSWAVLWETGLCLPHLTGLCRAGLSWRCCPEGTSENRGLKRAWWTSAVPRVVNEYGNADQISCPATGYSLLPRARVSGIWDSLLR